MPSPISRIVGVISSNTLPLTKNVATIAATGIDTASPVTPDTRSPTRWVSRM